MWRISAGLKFQPITPAEIPSRLFEQIFFTHAWSGMSLSFASVFLFLFFFFFFFVITSFIFTTIFLFWCHILHAN